MKSVELNLVRTVLFLFSLHSMIRSNTTINTTNNSEVENPKFYLKKCANKTVVSLDLPGGRRSCSGAFLVFQTGLGSRISVLAGPSNSRL